MGLLVFAGALSAEFLFWHLGGALHLWPALLGASLAALFGAALGLQARARLLKGVRLWPLSVWAASLGVLFGVLFGVLVGSGEALGIFLLRVVFLGSAALLGGAWTASGVRRIAMTC